LAKRGCMIRAINQNAGDTGLRFSGD
jgi:hypothetical protein